MRKKLQKIDNVRRTFIGKFVRFGKKYSFGYEKDTILLCDIKDMDSNLITDHLWFNKTKGFDELNLQKDDIIQFDARVKDYTKGYVNYREGLDLREKDYKLNYPTKIKVISRNGRVPAFEEVNPLK